MSSRPRRSAAQRASVAITDMADRDNMSSSRSRRSGDGQASVSRGPQGGKDHTYLTVKMPSSKLRQATSHRSGSSIAVNSDTAPKRSTRGGKKSYVSKKTKNATPQKAAVQFSAPNDSDDDELSELESDEEMDIEGEEDAEGEEDDEDVDAEGDDIEEDQEAEAEPEPDAEAAPRPEDLGSDDEDNGSRGGTPDFTRMTVRQRARFEEVDSSHYQALSNEVQAKKHFTAEEKAMRRAEMARRRRNLSEKRNEEVKQETINKLLKKQASKTNRKGLQAIGEEGQDADGFKRPNPVFIHWVSRREGERIAIPGEILEGPAGRLFANSVRPSGAGPTGLAGPKKMVEEIA
ncbi:Ino eighty subunit 2 [Cytospora mali]|uniref:Ino eighty subunit 2 n=1 Tax=Cytospora mali TaxID=578113 RepID=A0A194VDW7_CYTMA|nr:Ino eighty subunit 2 [Valsa mali var. pyri (nom. inval.)]